MEIDKKLYYNPNLLYSYNRLLNFVISERGLGKTYGFKKRVINNYLKNDEQFIYLRRYRTEFKKLPMFFKDITANNEFPNHKLEVKGKQLLIDGKTAGYAIALSTWLQEKSNSYPNVTTVIFDEFLVEKSLVRYLPGEVDAFLNMLDTIIRNRDNVKAFLLANSVTIANPYFVYFNLQPNVHKRFNAYENVVIEIPQSRDFMKEREKTKFGSLIKNTEYGNFALGNEFVNDSPDFIERRSKDSIFSFGIQYHDAVIGVWISYAMGLIYCSSKLDPDGQMYALTTKDHRPNLLLLSNYKQNPYLNQVSKAFQKGYLRFDNQYIKNTMYDIFRHMSL